MELAQLEQFIAIADCGTMSEAAKRLYLSQPTLSYNLKKLEAELGCQLFVRAHNRLRPTAYGELVYEHSSDIVGRMSTLLASVEDMRRREAATLHIGCFSFLVSGFLMTHIAAEMPDSVFDVVNCPPTDLLEGLETGRFDLLIAPDSLRRKPFKWRRLYEERACVSAPDSDPVASRDVVTPEDLAALSFDIETGLYGYSDWYSQILAQAGVPDESIGHVELMEHLRFKDTLPSCNLITTFIMDFVRANDSRAIIPIALDSAVRCVGLLYRTDAEEKVTEFVSHVQSSGNRLFSGNTFIPHFLFPEQTTNLHITNE